MKLKMLLTFTYDTCFENEKLNHLLFERNIGKKRCEMSNHLENVLAFVSEFLWGASARALGVGFNIALYGAHACSYLNTGKLDSKDDQTSISLGWVWKFYLDKNK